MTSSSSSSISTDPPRRGLGFNNPKPPSPASSVPSESDSSDGGEVPGLRKEFGGRLSRSQKRRRTPTPPPDSKAGAWEAHTRGIGSKILAKQGFTGRLGKRGDGIIEPLRPVVRKGKLGLGAGNQRGNHHKQQQADLIQEDLDAKIDAMRNRLRRQKHSHGTEIGRTKTEALIPLQEPNHVPKVPSVAIQSEVNMALDLARSSVTIVPPYILYDLNRLRDTAIAKLSSVKRGLQTENFIMQNTKSEMEKGKHEVEQVKIGLKHLVSLENAFAGFQRVDDVAFAASIIQVSDAIKEMGGKYGIKRDLVIAALLEQACQFIRQKLTSCFQRSQEDGKANKKLANLVYDVLKAVGAILSRDEHTKFCTISVLDPLRKWLSIPGWDTIRGACIADILVIIRSELQEGLVQVFAEEVLVPRLLDHIRKTRRQGDGQIPPHIWIHPWLPVTGRKALVEVLHHVRISLSVSLEKWTLSDPTSQRDSIVRQVHKWSAILSRKKLQVSLSRHITSKLAIAFQSYDGASTGLSSLFEALATWTSVCSNRLMATELSEPFLVGLGCMLRDVAFQNWEKAKSMYTDWYFWIPARMRLYFRPVLAALLFILHSARVAKGNSRSRLMHADVRVLLKNRFVKSSAKRTFKKNLTEVPVKNARLVDVVAMIAEKEGLAVIGLEDEKGLRAFRIGRIRVTADVGRGVLMVGGEIVSVTKLIRMAKGEHE